MKLKTTLLAFAAFSTLNLQPSIAFAQGSLTPPDGAPAPVMKSLDQIEARTPISSAPFTITKPGSYYLTSNLTVATGNAITITTNSVSLDLNGFTISSTALSATGTAISLSVPLANITIQNGSILSGATNNSQGAMTGPGFAYGIRVEIDYPSSQNIRISKISVLGCLHDGIAIYDSLSSVVEDCNVRSVGGYGINAGRVKNSSVTAALGHGIYATEVIDCHGESLGSGDAIHAEVAANCVGQSQTGHGVYALNASNCRGTSQAGKGLFSQNAQNCSGSSGLSVGLHSAGSAVGCTGTSGTSIGLLAEVAVNCYAWSWVSCAIEARIGNSCVTWNGTNNITHKYNMP
jgi:hypothetical protein